MTYLEPSTKRRKNTWTWWTSDSSKTGGQFSSSSADRLHRNTHCHVSVVEVLFLFTFDLLFLLCSPDVVTSDLHISCCLAGCAALMVPFFGYSWRVAAFYNIQINILVHLETHDAFRIVSNPNPHAATSGRLCWSEKACALTFTVKGFHEEMDHPTAHTPSHSNYLQHSYSFRGIAMRCIIRFLLKNCFWIVHPFGESIGFRGAGFWKLKPPTCRLYVSNQPQVFEWLNRCFFVCNFFEAILTL